MSDAVRINGNQLSYGSITLKLAGVVYYGFTGLSYGDKRERVKAYGMGRHHAPRGRSRGKYTVEPVKLTGWKSSVAEARRALAQQAQGGLSYADIEFQITAAYTELDETPVFVEINRCVWVGSSESNEENPDPLKEEIEIDPMVIYRDGLTLFDRSEGSPV
jgi:hypothetical protein